MCVSARPIASILKRNVLYFLWGGGGGGGGGEREREKERQANLILMNYS